MKSQMTKRPTDYLSSWDHLADEKTKWFLNSRPLKLNLNLSAFLTDRKSNAHFEVDAKPAQLEKGSILRKSAEMKKLLKT